MSRCCVPVRRDETLRITGSCAAAARAASRECLEQRCSFVRSQHGVCLARSFVGAGFDLVEVLTGARGR